MNVIPDTIQSLLTAQIMKERPDMKEHVAQKEAFRLWAFVASAGLRMFSENEESPVVPAPQDPQSWFCPHCGCDRPQYTVLINNPVQMIGVGLIQTAALVCMGKLPGKDSAGGDILCRHVLSVQVVNLQLDDALLRPSRSHLAI